MYIRFHIGCHFGVLDIIGSCISNDDFVTDDWPKYQDSLKRLFSAQCIKPSNFLTLPISAIEKIKDKFTDCYKDLFQKTTARLRKTINVKT